MVKLTELPHGTPSPNAHHEAEFEHLSDIDSDSESTTSSSSSGSSEPSHIHHNGPVIPKGSAAIVYALYLYALKYPILTLLPIYARSAIKTSLAFSHANASPSIRQSYRSTRFSIVGYLYFVLYYLATSKGCLPGGPLEGMAFGKIGEEVTVGFGLRVIILLVRVLAGRGFVGSVSRDAGPGMGVFDGGRKRLWRDVVSLFFLQRGMSLHRSILSNLEAAPMVEWLAERLFLGGLESGVMRVVGGVDGSIWEGLRHGGRWGTVWRGAAVELGGMMVGVVGEGLAMTCEVGLWKGWGVRQSWMEGWEK